MSRSVPQREQSEHFNTPGGVVWSPASAYSQELAKWETRSRDDGSVTQQMINAARQAGVHHGTFEHKEYPRVMYRFEQTPYGIKLAEHRTVASLTEQRNLESRGFATTQDEAVAVVEQANQDAAEAAANRAFHDRRLSDKAQAEAERIDLSVARHLGEIPEERIVRREKIDVDALNLNEPPVAKRSPGRPRKAEE